MSSFTFTDEEFIIVLNKLAQKELAGDKTFTPVTSIEDSLEDLALDSLGMMMFFVWLTEVFEVPDDKVTEFTVAGDFKVATLKEFVATNATQTFSYEEAMEFDRTCT